MLRNFTPRVNRVARTFDKADTHRGEGEFNYRENLLLIVIMNRDDLFYGFDGKKNPNAMEEAISYFLSDSHAFCKSWRGGVSDYGVFFMECLLWAIPVVEYQYPAITPHYALENQPPRHVEEFKFLPGDLRQNLSTCLEQIMATLVEECACRFLAKSYMTQYGEEDVQPISKARIADIKPAELYYYGASLAIEGLAAAPTFFKSSDNRFLDTASYKTFTNLLHQQLDGMLAHDPETFFEFFRHLQKDLRCHQDDQRALNAWLMPIQDYFLAKKGRQAVPVSGEQFLSDMMDIGFEAYARKHMPSMPAAKFARVHLISGKVSGARPPGAFLQ